MLRDLIDRLTALATVFHYGCEDRWYSCPQHPDGCDNDNAGAECNCGAEAHNKLVAQLAMEIGKLIPKESEIVNPIPPPIGGRPDDRFWKMPEIK